ncbi:hypothetical protein [Flavobacterium sp.]|uniref:hypothetical protein n=1 Tax=Flavobacterium sp. TaxID=239 RepID=UPI00374CDE29
MNENNLSKETEAKLIDFFSNTIDPESFAKAIRQLNYVIALSRVLEKENKYAQKENLEHGLPRLNELADILNPYLEFKKI